MAVWKMSSDQGMGYGHWLWAEVLEYPLILIRPFWTSSDRYNVVRNHERWQTCPALSSALCLLADGLPPLGYKAFYEQW